MNRLIKNTKPILLMTFVCLFCTTAFLFVLPETGSAAYAAQDSLIVADTAPDSTDINAVTSTESPQAPSDTTTAETGQDQTASRGLNGKKGAVLAILLIVSYLAGRSSYNKVANKNKK